MKPGVLRGLSHLEHDAHDGAGHVQDAGNKADDDGAPGVDGGAAGCDGDQACQGTVAHDADIVRHAACT